MQQNGTSRRRRLMGWLALWISILITLVLAEGIVRVADRLELVQVWGDTGEARRASIWTADPTPGLIYRHRPNYVKDGIRQTESHGILRPEEVSPRAAEGRVRIALLGDSVSASLHLDYAERASTLVEAELGDRFEVLNFGVNGYSTQQEAILLERLVAGFEPDLLILQYCVNDLRTNAHPAKWFEPHSPSYLVEFVTGLFDRRFLDGYPPATFWEELYRDDTEGWASVVDGFDRVADYAEGRGIAVLMVVFPALSKEGWDAGDAEGRHARVTEAGRAAGFEVLDLLPVYAEYDVESLRANRWDTFHPNAEGQRIAAEAIVGRLVRFDRQRPTDGSPGSPR